MEGPKKQASLFSFFQKTPKSKAGPNGDTSAAESNKKAPMKTQTESAWEAGLLVWARLTGYPWWPAILCNHPTLDKVERRVEGQREYHVQFLGEQSRSWISADCVRRWEKEVNKSEGEKDESWKKGVEEAENVKTLSNQERLDLLLVPLLPSDDDWSDQEVSPGSKENKVQSKSPKNKKRRVMVLDSDDSDGDEDFKPSKEDLKLAKDEVDEEGSDVSSDEPSSEEEPESSPAKGTKRKMTKKQPMSKAKKPKSSPEAASSLAGSMGKFASGLPSTPTSSRPLPGIADSTKKKLSMFGAPTAATASPEEEGAGMVYTHQKLDWLRPENIKDKEGRKKDHPDYDPRTLYVPKDFLNKQTPGLKQWWTLKSQYHDVILFFKMGKFYELFCMDADVGVAELNLVYMRGEQAHAGFPEAAYSKWATTLVEKGYKVARIEQTETPAQLEERNKSKSGPKDKVVAREVCQLSTKGTRVNTFLDSHNFEGDPSYLLALCERPGPVFGVAFVDTTLGCFHLGQFEDDANLSRLRTLLAHYPPGELLQPRGGLSQATYNCLATTGARRELLRPGVEFWDSSKALKVLAEREYFKSEEGKFQWPEKIAALLEPSDTLGLTASKMGDLAVSSLGAITFYLSAAFLDQQLLSQRRFESYQPLDIGPAGTTALDEEAKGPQGKHMVLDGATVANLELLTNSTGGQDAALVNLFSPVTAMGKRLLTQWILSPLLQPKAIRARQAAIQDLMNAQQLEQMRALLKKFPDLERLLSKVHAAGDKVKSEKHPDSRAVFFEAERYSKRKIWDMLSLLEGFKQCKGLVELLSSLSTKSKLLQEVSKLGVNGGQFPDLEPITDFFDDSFDHQKAKADGKISPKTGDLDELDDLKERMKDLRKEMDTYLREQKTQFGCEVKYWGQGKNRYQLEVPLSKVNKATRDYELASGTKAVKRYTTSETREFLERQQAAEAEEERLVAEHQRKIFARFSQYAAEWQRAIACISLLDCLGSLAAYSKGLEEGCFPTILEDFSHPSVDIEEGRHPCLDLPGSNYIANNTRLGGDGDTSSLIILTGPNMGGKSTLMRQTGLLVVLAQVGCLVPARAMKLTPVDRVFTRLGARDDIVSGQSTFFVELQETSSILAHASHHSLVLIDELGRGTATYDGTAIAGSVVSWLAKKGCLTLFATHYHCLATEVKAGVAAAHMACMVENEGAEDITEENITFLYKLVDGAAPKSHGFNAAKLAGLPASIIRTGFARAKEFEQAEKMREMFKNLFTVGAEGDLDNLVEKIKAL